MAAPLLSRAIPLFRIRLQHSQQRLAVWLIEPLRKSWCSAAAESSAKSEEDVFPAEKTTTVLTARNPFKDERWKAPDYRKWRHEEEEILRDIEPIISLIKDILHSDRYMDGECLTTEDQKAVVEKLLAYHPHSEDKIGCGLDSIMVDRHPQFRQSRCLFVVRTDGGWIDFSYQKCLRAYIRDKYPSHAERFIREHYNRGRD
ncbi:protein DCL, chloroplastic isoform X1 [Carica papaya]|uniref:protein DCL, chloroplastic isoform X1 n=1 Tax=Carica papaya TaxID=3649 RepID=UPI000B8CF183|nr:protein DCL, chloroplastic isoform X1 [Carica papaya]